MKGQHFLDHCVKFTLFALLSSHCKLIFSIHSGGFYVFVYVNIKHTAVMFTYFFLQEGVTHIGSQEQFKEPEIGIIHSFVFLQQFYKSKSELLQSCHAVDL